MNSYEVQRLENIKPNQKLLADLSLHVLKTDPGAPLHTKVQPSPLKRRRNNIGNVPSRISARIAASARPPYDETVSEKDKLVKHSRKTGKLLSRASTPSEPRSDGTADDRPVTSLDAERLRAHWTEWLPITTPPVRQEDGSFHFQSHPAFTPNKSPEEVIREGCFGGSYFRPLKSRKLGILVEDDYKELQQSWIHGLEVSKYLTSLKYDPDVNKFEVTCGQSIEEWEAAGWINHEFDVRGWFQWYCRFFQGRRCEDDDRQVSRWRKCVGETGRWRRMLLEKYMVLGVHEVFDDGADEETPEVSPVMHQTCHHWAFEMRQNVLDDFWRKSG